MKPTALSVIIIFACLILSINSIRSITESYNVGSIYDSRKQQLKRQYVEVVAKKNELDYVNTAFFAEKQIRESLNMYKKGEKLVVFTSDPIPETSSETLGTKINPWDEWREVLIKGIVYPKL